jgi:hypothetical protein
LYGISRSLAELRAGSARSSWAKSVGFSGAFIGSKSLADQGVNIGFSPFFEKNTGLKARSA